MPTGVQLFENASQENERMQSKTSALADRFFSTFWEFIRFAHLHAEQQLFRELVRHLRSSHTYSIDLFAYNNPSFAEISKLYTVWALVNEMFDKKVANLGYADQHVTIERKAPWLLPKVGSGKNERHNWLGELSNIFLQGADNPAQLSRNQLTFVTFNYDPIIEEAFPRIVRRNERYAESRDEIMPKVIHVHGKMDHPDIDCVKPDFYSTQASRIKFISDTIDSPSSEVFEAVHLLSNAEKVYSVGFAFEELNASLLKADVWGKNTVALNYDGNSRVSNEMRRVGVPRSNIWSGTDANKLQLGVAASRGFFRA